MIEHSMQQPAASVQTVFVLFTWGPNSAISDYVRRHNTPLRILTKATQVGTKFLKLLKYIVKVEECVHCGVNNSLYNNMLNIVLQHCYA